MKNLNERQTEYKEEMIYPTEGEIDIIALIKRLWSNRNTLILCILIFTLIGVFVSIYTPVEYTAKTIMVPQIQSKTSGLGGLSTLAAMAGFNLDAMQGTSSELSPMVYPQIVKSIPFQKSIMHIPLNWKESKNPVSLLTYFDSLSKPNPLSFVKKYTLGLPGVILKWIKGSPENPFCVAEGGESLITLTLEEKQTREVLSNSLSIEVNSKDGYLTLTAIAPEALAAAEIAQNAQLLLQQKVTEFKIIKARQNLDFIQALFEDRKKDFYDAQARLARFRDQNLNLGPATAKTEEEKLQSEYQVAFSVYSELAKQLETAKITVKQDTPIFSIIEPVSIPTEKSKPNKPMIVFTWILLGCIFGVGWIFGKQYLKQVGKKWANG
jgi:LPS O-antigen subunit length determinant protein (WzzB/FepE family)